MLRRLLLGGGLVAGLVVALVAFDVAPVAHGHDAYELPGCGPAPCPTYRTRAYGWGRCGGIYNRYEARHLGRFHRWDQGGMTHPYLTGKNHLYELVPSKRFTCYPIADSECQTNPLVADLCI